MIEQTKIPESSFYVHFIFFLHFFQSEYSENLRKNGGRVKAKKKCDGNTSNKNNTATLLLLVTFSNYS